jgi:hypothetical protein
VRKVILSCAMLAALGVSAQAQVLIDRYGNTYVPDGAGGGFLVGVNPITGRPATGYMPVTRMPESDPSMFGQVRPDGSIIGLDGQ